ncbi:MAG TPA: VOC family protein [Ktedonobacteraceae bacterium]|nr:VOC family protein [Ktedonobacteraceae bacterium]
MYSEIFAAIHYAALRVADVDEARQRWSRVLGLTGKLEDGRALLRCAHEDYALVLEQSSQQPGIEYVAYELAPGVSLATMRSRLSNYGVQALEIEVPRRDTALRLNDPDGNGVVILAYQRPADPRPAEVLYSDTLSAFHPRKFGHVNYLTSNVAQAVQWYIDVLGFKLTDGIGAEGRWLHVNADHHVLAFLEKGYNHIHHLAFELVDWGELRVALDHLAQHRRAIVWGPGRHGMARNLFSYFRMQEEELFVELFADMERLPVNHEPRYFPDDAHSSNTWGILPPRSYFRFDEQAIRAEQEQFAAHADYLAV